MLSASGGKIIFGDYSEDDGDFEEHVAHQGVAALVSPVEYIELDDFLNLPSAEMNFFLKVDGDLLFV